jgi:hypothetical protein
MKRNNHKPTKDAVSADIAATYNEFKEFEGKRYTGVRIGRGHKWYYDRGEWTEKKVTPDQWTINYAVTKRRAGHAPEGSGVPVGTQYHWYILAHQNVTKLNANDYSTSLTGLKFKLAHKRAGSEKWSATAQDQRNRIIKILQQLIHELEQNANEEAKRPESKPTMKHRLMKHRLSGRAAVRSKKRTVRSKPSRAA